MTKKSYYFYGYRFKKTDIADRYKDLPFEGVENMIIPALEKYLTNAMAIKIGAISFINRDDWWYIGYYLHSLKSGDRLPNTNNYTVDHTRASALIKAWREVKFTKSEMLKELDYWFI